ncbi:glycosyltransferase [bacterium]|nr:MAG: glycosyltransferase [bacterium]
MRIYPLPSIALLHYSCPPVIGGVEEILRQQAALFHRLGHRVIVFTGEGAVFEDLPVQIHPLLGSGNPDVKAVQRNLPGNSGGLEGLKNQILNYLTVNLEKVDIVIAHNVLTMHYNLPLTLALHELAKRASPKVVCWGHDSPFFYDDYSLDLTEEPWGILSKYNHDITYITISGSRQKQFEELFGGEPSIDVVPNGIDPVTFFNLGSRIGDAVREMDLFDADLLLVQPSRLHPRKNIEFSIEVIHAFRKMKVKARLLLSGSYDPHEESTLNYYEKLKGFARKLDVEDDILVMADLLLNGGRGFSAEPINIHGLYLIADVMLLPSLQEGFGLPLLEAGLFKLPIVCSDIAPFREVTRGDVCIFSFEDSAEDVAQKIMDLVNSSPSNRMYRNIIRNYLWKNIYRQKIAPLFERILES